MPPEHSPPDRRDKPGGSPTVSLHDSQQRSILFGLLDLHRKMAEMEGLLTEPAEWSPFSQYVNDVSPSEAEGIRDYFGRLRARMIVWLQQSGAPIDARRTSLTRALQIGMDFLHVGVAEMSPARLRGYGPVDDAGAAAVVQVQQDLDRLIDGLRAYLREGRYHRQA